MLECVCVCMCVCEDLYSCLLVHMSCAMHAYPCAWGHECLCILNCKMYNLTQLNSYY